MPLREIIRLSIEGLFANKFRTTLTMLGMVIGVGAVVLLVSVGTGAKKYVLSEFEGLGTNLIIVQPGKTDKKSSHGPPIGVAQRKMTLEDVVALEKRSFNLEAITGLVMGTTTVKFQESTNNVNVFGTNDNFIRILNLAIEEGEFFTREEDDFGRRVIVLGHQIASDLFGETIPLGKQVRLHQSEFRVVGVMRETGDKLGINFDEFVFIPTKAALRIFNDDKLFGIRAKAKSRANIKDAVDEITTILKERRDGEEDFTVVTQDSMMESLGSILSMLTYVLACIAFISMIVGGIGIMNIMLVSVAERTSEIGIRRAVGARRIDILKQFLAEAMMLSVTAGLIGVLGSAGITHVLHWIFPSFDLRAPFWILPPAFLLSVVVGVVFGVWPARKASHIETLEALRYE